MSELLAVREISKTFDSGGCPAVDQVSFDCRKGEVLAIVGGSGSGKTTLLRIIAGLEIPDSGEIMLDGERINGQTNFLPPEKRDCTLVFQDFALFPNLTVWRNVTFGKGASEDPEGLEKLMAMAEISDLRDRYPHEISGGQQQRVALVRALATKPLLLLLDEPLSQLDPELRENVRRELLALLIESGVTTLFVSHDTEDALAMADKVVVLRDGKTEQMGTPAEAYRKPANSYVAKLFGKTNLLPAELVATGRHRFEDSEGGGELVSVRPGEWRVVDPAHDSDTPVLTGRVKSIHDRGGHREILLVGERFEVVARLPLGVESEVGDELSITC